MIILSVLQYQNEPISFWGKEIRGISSIKSHAILYAVLGLLQPGQHGSTFGGNPLACAVAREALKVLVKENMIENAEKMGAYFLAELEKIKQPAIKEVRGIGLMIAIELVEGTPGGARAICESLMKMGILCKETHTYTIRFAPPLIIEQQDIDWAVDKIKTAFA